MLHVTISKAGCIVSVLYCIQWSISMDVVTVIMYVCLCVLADSTPILARASRPQSIFKFAQGSSQTCAATSARYDAWRSHVLSFREAIECEQRVDTAAFNQYKKHLKQPNT